MRLEHRELLFVLKEFRALQEEAASEGFELILEDVQIVIRKPGSDTTGLAQTLEEATKFIDGWREGREELQNEIDKQLEERIVDEEIR